MASKKTARKKTTRKAATKKTASRSSSSTSRTSKKATAKKSTKKKAAKSSARKSSSTRAPKTRRDGPFSVSREIGGRELSLETGRMAKLADGAIVARYGDTMVLATAQASGHESDMGFFPLTVDYREKAAAAGKFPGGFFKREGRPTTREILTCRIIDRSIRPLFADGFKRETQVLIQVLSTDKENDSDMLAAVAGFAALAISSIPNGKTLGACRIGLIDGKLKINPTWSDLQSDDNRLNLTISAHNDAIVMVEAGADQVSEEVMLEALELGHEVCTEIGDMIDELVDLCGKPKMDFTPPFFDQELFEEIEADFGEDVKAAAVAGGTKFDRGAAKDAAKREVREAFPAPKGADDKAAAEHKKQVDASLEKLFKQGERESILRGKRADGRGPTDIRDLSIEVGVLPRVHGSALFTRGETQALCTATLGTMEDQQFIDGIYPEDRKRWLLHYNFPPFSVGEVRRFGSPGRREIGHGALAERSVEPVLPDRDSFTYSMRVTSEILESNGSSSMASVCGATLALMDAGVPLAQPVAGIAMGLVVEGDEIAILSDILGSEDHCGDMDFKVSGTGKGITALQMDIKCEGLARETLEEALEQARKGRVHILRAMLATIREPRSEVSRFAPRLVTIQVPQEKVGAIIGPAGRTIRGMQEEFECRIAVMDEGRVEISGTEADKVDACIARIEEMTEDVQMGKTYTGKITGLKEFGCFVEILPGQEGLVHVSELAHGFIRSVADEVQVGDEIEVKVIDIDDFGKVKLSRKALLPMPEGEEGGGDRGRDSDRGRGRDRGDRRDRDERRDRDDRGGRDERGGRGRGRGRREREEEFEPETEVEAEVDVEDEFELEAEFDDEEETEFEPDFEEFEDEESESEPEEAPRGRRGGSRRSDEERPSRGRGRRDDEGRGGRGRRDEGDRPARGRGRGRDDDERPARGRGRGRDDDERPARGRGRGGDDERPARGRGRGGDDEDRPSRGRGRGRDDDERPARGRGRGRDDERPARSRRDDDERPSRGRGRGRDADGEFDEVRPEPAGGERRRRRRRSRDD